MIKIINKAKKLKIHFQLRPLEMYMWKKKRIILEVIKVCNNFSKLNKKHIIIIKINNNQAFLLIEFYNKKY